MARTKLGCLSHPSYFLGAGFPHKLSVLHKNSGEKESRALNPGSLLSGMYSQVPQGKSDSGESNAPCMSANATLTNPMFYRE